MTAALATESYTCPRCGERSTKGEISGKGFHCPRCTLEHWERLEADIQSILTNDATVREQTEYGQKLEVRGSITGPAERNAEIVTAWIVLKGESIPRFITAYPGD